MAKEEEKPEENKEATVPQSRLDEVIKERDDQKAANEALQTNLQLMRNNPPQQTGKVEQFDIFKHVGLDPDDPLDIPNQKQLKEIFAYQQGLIRSEGAMQRFLSEHADFPELVGTTAQIRAGQFAEPFLEVQKEHPAEMRDALDSQNPQSAVYGLVKLHQKNKAKGAKATKKDAKNAIDEAVENANRVKSSSNTKGGEGLSEEGRYESMSDEEFYELAQSHGAEP